MWWCIPVSSTWEEEARGLKSLRLGRATERIQYGPELHGETLLQKKPRTSTMVQWQNTCLAWGRPPKNCKKNLFKFTLNDLTVKIIYGLKNTE